MIKYKYFIYDKDLKIEDEISRYMVEIILKDAKELILEDLHQGKQFESLHKIIRAIKEKS